MDPCILKATQETASFISEGEAPSLANSEAPSLAVVDNYHPSEPNSSVPRRLARDTQWHAYTDFEAFYGSVLGPSHAGMEPA